MDSSNAASLARDEPEQRREAMRKIQIEDLDLEVINPDAAAADLIRDLEFPLKRFLRKT